MTRLCRLLTAALLLLAPSARAQTQTDLLNGFDNFTIHDPVVSGGKVVNYGATGPNPHWTIAQWNIPGQKLTPFARQDEAGQTEFNATAPEASVKVLETADGMQVQLSQDGAQLPCDNPGNRPRESDLFIGSKIIPAQFEKTPLSQMTALRQIVWVASTGAPTNPPKNCSLNAGAGIISVVLADKAVHPAQIFFYQLDVSEVCREEPGSRSCNRSHNDLAYYAKTNPFGVGDYLPILGTSYAAGSLKKIDVDILPRLAKAISEGPPALDHDLSHWRVGGVYGGQLIWGDVKLTTTWRGYRLVAETP